MKVFTKKLGLLLLLLPLSSEAQQLSVAVAPQPANTFVANPTSSAAIPTAINPLSAANLMGAVLSVNLVAISNITLSGVQTIDGVVATAGMTVLVTAQNTSSQDGIYVVQSGAWTLAVNFPSGYVIAAGCNLTVEIQQGSQYAGTSWFLNTSSAITIGTTAQTWSQIGSGTVTGVTFTSPAETALTVTPGISATVLNIEGASSPIGPAGSIQIFGGAPAGTSHGSLIAITASNGGGTGSGGSGGAIDINSGAAGGTSGNGGNITVIGGAGSGSGKTSSSISFTPGAANSGSTAGVVNVKGPFQLGGTQGALSGCSATGQLGGQLAGQYTSGTTGSCSVTIVLTAFTSQNGYFCEAYDETTPADIQSIVATTTSATVSGTTVSGDVVKWACVGY